MVSPPATDNSPEISQIKAIFADGYSAALLASHAEILSSGDPAIFELVKHNPSRTVFKGQIGKLEVYIKHFHSLSFAHRIAGKIGISDAMRELKFSKYLRTHGVQTVEAMAIICKNDSEWLVTRGVSPCQPADVWHPEQLAKGQSSQRAIRQALLAVAEMIGRMHAAGVIHRDLHCGNILIRTDTPTPEPVLSDLHRIRRGRRLSRSTRAANLAQFFQLFFS